MKNAAINGLSQCLAETYTLYLNTQKCHWNVEGPDFPALHLMFEKQYEILADYADVLAERIRGLGAYAPGSFKEFEDLSNVPQVEELGIPSEKMIKILLSGYDILIDSMQKTMKVAEKMTDVGTADILLGQIEQHQKTIWMLKSTLKDPT